MDNYSEMTTAQDENSQLSEDLFRLQQYSEASTAQRFVNFLIDNLLMRYGLSYLTGSIVGLLLGTLFPEFAARLIEPGNELGLYLLGYIIGIFNYLFYYTICEKAFKGSTLGKLVSGTRAIRNDGKELTFKDALLRTLSRIVPFEPLSAFGGNPWHDSWTNTRVIKTR